MLHKDAVIIEKIIREIDFAVNRISEYSAKDFAEDIDAQHAVGMAVINTGELIKHISEELRRKFPSVPWKQAAGLRDIAAHTYDTIRMDDLYQTIKKDFPPLKKQLLTIAAEEE